jgi:simple sugar transport system permease protein
MDEFAAQVLRLSLPLLLAVLSEVIAERGGVVNLGIEGMLLLGALVAYLVGAGSGAAMLPVAWLAAAAAGVLLAGLLGLLTVTAGCNQIVAGTGVHFLCLGASGLLFERFKSTASVTSFDSLPLALAAVPYVLPWLLAAGLAYGLFRTRIGLEIRAVGEDPAALRAAGVCPRARRFLALLLAGAIAGLAGATLTTVLTGQFVEGMTHGRGFMALGMVVLARWHPFGAILAGLLLGATMAIELQLTTVTLQRPDAADRDGIVFLLRCLPYGVTILALAVPGPRRWPGPAALGEPA